MVKMVLGSSDTQASSVGTLADNYKAGFEQLVKSIDQLANEDRLSGSAYSNIKNYGSSVVKPLAQAFVLLAEAAKADIKKLPDEYRASVGSEDLDEETLTAQIHALNSTLATNRATKTAMKRIDSAADTQSFD
ncbi:T7SS effector LXG polymorphic toxin, partial [Streptococcus macacae]